VFIPTRRPCWESSWDCFFLLWGFVQSYVVLKSGSIWVAAFIHGLVNSLYAFQINYLVRPENALLSFGLGIYGLAILSVIVLLILRDPVWKS
jgi:membrane protease YdiL (CAAX protease family)